MGGPQSAIEPVCRPGGFLLPLRVDGSGAIKRDRSVGRIFKLAAALVILWAESGVRSQTWGLERLL